MLSPLIVISPIYVLGDTLDMLDKYNKLASGLAKDDKEDLAWPGVWSK